MFLTLSSIFPQTGVSAGFPSSGVLQPSASCKLQHLDTLRLQTLQVLADAHSPVRRQNDVERAPHAPPPPCSSSSRSCLRGLPDPTAPPSRHFKPAQHLTLAVPSG